MRRRDAYPALYGGSMDLTGLFAVAFVLAAFFLMTGGGGRSGATQFDVSLSTPALPGDEKLPTIAIARDGQLRLNGRPLTMDELQVSLATLRQQQNIDRVIVSTDSGARLQTVLETMAAIRSAGINRVAQRIQTQK